MASNDEGLGYKWLFLIRYEGVFVVIFFCLLLFSPFLWEGRGVKQYLMGFLCCKLIFILKWGLGLLIW